MAKLPDIKRVLREDVKDAPDWVSQIINPVNSFFESIYQALNRQLTFKDNVACEVRDIEFTTPASYPSDFTEVNFQSPLRTQIQGLLCLQIKLKSNNYMNITTSPFINWRDINGQINISYISGLAASTTYQLRVLVF